GMHCPCPDSQPWPSQIMLASQSASLEQLPPPSRGSPAAGAPVAPAGVEDVSTSGSTGSTACSPPASCWPPSPSATLGAVVGSLGRGSTFAPRQAKPDKARPKASAMSGTRCEANMPTFTVFAAPSCSRPLSPASAGGAGSRTLRCPGNRSLRVTGSHPAAIVRLEPVAKRTRTLLVANPTARTGKAKRAIDAAIQGLEAAGLNPEFIATQPEGKTVDAVAERLEREDVARVAY